jgi:hypothetical protein
MPSRKVSDSRTFVNAEGSFVTANQFFNLGIVGGDSSRRFVAARRQNATNRRQESPPTAKADRPWFHRRHPLCRKVMDDCRAEAERTGGH